jgi:hypothetical protein
MAGWQGEGGAGVDGGQRRAQGRGPEPGGPAPERPEDLARANGRGRPSKVPSESHAYDATAPTVNAPTSFCSS